MREMEDWRRNLIEDRTGVDRILEECRRIAVLGIKPESRAYRPAHFVPAYMADAGYTILPVPVYYPDVRTILGAPVYRRLAELPGPVDAVCVFRKPSDIPAHLPDLLELAPRVVWFQSGITHAQAAEALARAGIRVVQDRCMMVDHRYRAMARRRDGA